MTWPAYQRTLILGLGHRARQGKDLVVKLLQEAYPGRVFRVAMADALKAHCRIAHGMTLKDGPLLQRVGVEARATDQDVWVRAAAWAIAELDADARDRQVVCVPDVRFPNEFAFIAQAGGVLAKVQRLDAEGAPFIATDRPSDHESEIALAEAPWPHVLAAQSGDVEALRAGAVSLVRDYLRTVVAYDDRRANARACTRCGRPAVTHPERCERSDRDCPFDVNFRTGVARVLG